MSKVLFAFAIGLVFCVPLAAARTQSRLGPAEDDLPVRSPAAKSAAKTEKSAAKTDAPKTNTGTGSRLTPKSDSKSEESKVDARPSEAQNVPATLTSAAANSAGGINAPPATTSDAAPKTPSASLPVFGSPSVLGFPAPPKYESPAPLKTPESTIVANGVATTTVPGPAAAAAPAASAPTAPTALYRVGSGDILDIRLVNGMSRESTLYTVMSTGMLDYPLAGEPFNVVGMTTDEIGVRLAAELKRRAVFDRAQFRISVRDYVSHTATVSGLVDQPGAKILRREAVPLYVVLSEANPRADAGRAVIISRATGQSKTVDLADPAALNELISHGDIINIQARPQEFFYIGGQINAPGQKDFHLGMTLTQAILASGGVARDANGKVKITVSRQGADGRLVLTEYLLKDIETGQAPDPRLQAGDRVEVGRRR